MRIVIILCVALLVCGVFSPRDAASRMYDLRADGAEKQETARMIMQSALLFVPLTAGMAGIETSWRFGELPEESPVSDKDTLYVFDKALAEAEQLYCAPDTADNNTLPAVPRGYDALQTHIYHVFFRSAVHDVLEALAKQRASCFSIPGQNGAPTRYFIGDDGERA